MIERIYVFGVPATLVATAYVVLPGDEQVEVELELVHHDAGPRLRMNIDQVKDVLDRRFVG